VSGSNSSTSLVGSAGPSDKPKSNDEAPNLEPTIVEPTTMSDTNVTTAVVWISLWALCTICSYNIGKTKGRGGDSVALGLLLGPIGVIITARLHAAAPGLE
jgi:hypothetical protein